MMVAVATVSLSTYAAAQQQYLGNRDDIIVNHTNVLNSAAKQQVEIKKAEAKTSVLSVVKEKIGLNGGKVSVGEKPMETVTMGSSVVTEKVSSTTKTAAAPVTRAALPAGVGQSDIPPSAKPGECYAKVLFPARYETHTDRIQISEEQRVLDRIIPARYQTTTERIKIKEARQYWKAGHGPITKKDQVTGEILCLVEEPAEYKTIEKRVLVTPEKPEFKTVPAKYETITRKNTIESERWEWRRILCETNLGSESVTQIQRALRSKGYNLAVDGRLGQDTLSAINSYQLKNGLASRGITYETLSHLGVRLRGA